MIKYTITCPNCGKEKTFEKQFPSSYENKFCNRACATAYYDKQRWTDPIMRDRITTAIAKSHNNPKRKEKMDKYWTLEVREQRSQKSKQLWEDPEYRALVCRRASQSKIKQWKEPEYRERVLKIFQSESFRTNASEYSSERWADPAYRDNIIISMKNAAIKRWSNPDFYKKMCKIAQIRWADPNWAQQQIEKMLNGQRYCPTKPELKMLHILNTNNYPYKYTGDRSFWIGRQNPDFLWKEKKFIIEMFGSYWHEEAEIKPRTENYAKYGYKALIIWDYELDNIDQLLAKLKEFHLRLEVD